MNQSDRAALAEISKKLDALGEEVRAFEHLSREETIEALKYLGKPETVESIKSLVLIAPTLIDLAEGYKAAGWFGRFIKWIGGIGGAILALVAIWTIFFGDQKP
jgi:hypothetical protein